MKRMLGKLTHLGAAAVGALLVAVSVLVVASSNPAAADSINPCANPTPGTPLPDWCLDGTNGGGGAPSGGGSGSGGGGSTGAPACGWVSIPADRVPAPNSNTTAIFTNGRPTPGVDVTWQGWCYKAPGTDFRGPFRWLLGNAAVPTVLQSPLDVAQAAYESIQGRMPDPVVVTSPPIGVDATVRVPVFVTVANWLPELVETRPLLGDTVTVRATPTLVVTSGEPGSVSKTCAGPGLPYDPASGDLWAQASAPGSCTFTYERRTGVADRPAQWPSTVVVRWSISWSSSSGQGGVFPVVERAVSLPRGVVEVQTVVVGGED